jgi:hypothetical protein
LGEQRRDFFVGYPDECPDAKPRDEAKVKFITPTL